MQRTYTHYILALAAAFALAGCMHAEAAPAESLRINANPGTQYGNRTFTNVVWGDGYPLVSVAFVTDASIVFSPDHGSGQKQRFANNSLTPGTLQNDNPDFISIYTNILRLNAMIADTGTVTTTYTFSAPMTLIDLIICDVDDNDMLQVSATGPGGIPLSPSIFQFIADGDLSMTNNAGGRPPLELATPPLWDPVSGVLTSVVSWNENRTFTILRVPEGTAVESIVLTFNGYRADNDGPDGSGLGAHIYVNLWATPRAPVMSAAMAEDFSAQWTIPTLPGLSYSVSASTNTTTWEVLGSFAGPTAPTGHVVWADTDFTNQTSVFRLYRYGFVAP